MKLIESEDWNGLFKFSYDAVFDLLRDVYQW
jgi:hypothetical protein